MKATIVIRRAFSEIGADWWLPTVTIASTLQNSLRPRP